MGKAFWLVFAASFCVNMGLNFSNSVLPVYAQSIGCAAPLIGLITGIFAVSSCMMKIVSGPAFDSFDRKRIVCGALVCMAVSYAMYSVAENEYLLMVASLVRGSAQAFTSAGCMLIAADCLGRDRLGSGISTFSLAQIICQAIGPMCALGVATVIGYRPTFLISVAFCLAGIALLLSANTDSRGDRPFRIAWNRIICPGVFRFAAIAMLLQTTVFAVIAFMAVFEMSLGIPQELTGLYFTIYVAALSAVRLLIGRLGDAVGPKRVMVPTLAVLGLAFAVLGFAHGIAELAVAAILNAVGISCMPLLQASAYRVTPDSLHGAVTSTMFLGIDAGTILGPVAGGLLVEFGGYSVMWPCMIVPVAAALTLCLTISWDTPEK